LTFVTEHPQPGVLFFVGLLPTLHVPG
jgi:hypothetical protein